MFKEKMAEKYQAILSCGLYRYLKVYMHNNDLIIVNFAGNYPDFIYVF